MITRIDFDRIIVVAGAKSLGSGEPAQDLREQTFHSRDGWDIRESLPGVFSLYRDGMADPVSVVGVGASFVNAPAPEPPSLTIDVRCIESLDRSVVCKLGSVSCPLPHGWPEPTKTQLAAVVPSKGKKR